MLPYNKYANMLRRLDEASPESTRLNPAELWHGGLSANTSRLCRESKSRRKAALRVKTSRHMKLG